MSYSIDSRIDSRIEKALVQLVTRLLEYLVLHRIFRGDGIEGYRDKDLRTSSPPIFTETSTLV
jgi:hypothetical protein